MSEISVRPHIRELDAYVPGLSIAEIQQKYSLSQVIKMASNENPLGASPLAQEAVRRHAPFLVPLSPGRQSPSGPGPGRTARGGPVPGSVGNGSDEIIDLLIRILAEPGKHSLACFEPCFSIYPIQGRISGVEVRRCPLEKDFSFNFDALLDLVDQSTRLVFVTTPDNPSGYCPPREAVADLARRILPREGGPVIPRDYGQEPPQVAEKETRLAMEVSAPQFLTAYKCTPAADGEDYLAWLFWETWPATSYWETPAPCTSGSMRKGSSTPASAAPLR